MTVALTFAGTTIAEWHHLAGLATRGVDGNIIVFPMSSGRGFLKTGQGQQRPAGWAFADRPPNCNRITSTTLSTVWSTVGAVQALRAAGTLGALTFDSGAGSSVTVSNVRILEFSVDQAVIPVRVGSTVTYSLPFAIVFEEFVE
jgi:hypothetical protein